MKKTVLVLESGLRTDMGSDDLASQTPETLSSLDRSTLLLCVKNPEVRSAILACEDLRNMVLIESINHQNIPHLVDEKNASCLCLIELDVDREAEFRLCKTLRDRFNVPMVYPVLLAPESMEISISEALGLGAFDLIRWPWNADEFKARMIVATRVINAENSLYQMAMEDELTGLTNRLFLIQEMESHFEMWSEKSCSLIIADIDYFKRINDEYGHETGDRVLEFLSKVLKNSIRECDTVSRIGGEEFAIFCPGISGAEVVKVAERIKSNLANTDFSILVDGKISVTMSYGIACHDVRRTTQPSDLLSKADRQLYLSKNSGRNTISIQSD